MENKIAMVGFGELGEQLFHFIMSADKRIIEAVFFDDVLAKENTPGAFPFDDRMDPIYNSFHFYVTLGYKHLEEKKKIITELLEQKRNLPSFIHSSSYIDPEVEIGHGTFIYPKCNIDKNVVIGNGVLLNNSVTVSHNSAIADCAYLSPGVIVSGKVMIGENTFIGAGSVVADGIKIGKNVRIGIGTVVTAAIPDNCSVIGNPMRFLSERLELR